jgi:hypothetical protein
MFQVNDDLSIYATRGDVGGLYVEATIGGAPYTFRGGDVVRFKAFGKKDCKNVVLQKDVIVAEDTTRVEIILDGNETKIGDVISKPVDYWYEVELNPETEQQTIIGYDDDGAKIFKLFPEGMDVCGGEVPNPGGNISGCHVPKVNEQDNGKFLVVVDGKWTATEVKSNDDRIDSLENAVADLLYKEIDITSFTITPSVAETGATVNDVILKWAVNKDPVTLTVEGDSVAVDLRETTLTGLELDTAHTFKIHATDEREATDSMTKTLSFYNGVYYGVITDGAALDSAAVLTLSKTLTNSRGRNFTVTCGDGQRIVYAIPTILGTPTFKVGGFEGGFYKAATIDFTNASGYTENYDIWLSSNTGLGATTVEVN